jgi:hypothetical protein
MKPVLLIYCFYAPWPMAIGSSQRIHQMFHELGKDFELVLYCGIGSLPADAHHPFDHVYHSGFLNRKLRKILKPAAVHKLLWKLIKLSFSGFFKLRTPDFLESTSHASRLDFVVRKMELLHLARRHRASALLGEYVWTVPDASVVTNVCGIPLIIDTHDVLSNRADNETKLSMDPPWHGIDRPTEIRFWKNADLLIAIQKTEMSEIRAECTGTPVVLAEHGLVIADGGNAGREEVPDRVLCVASSAKPNLHGLRLFLESQWAQVLAIRPEAEFHIVGTACSALAPDFSNTRGVILHGMVDDLTPHYEMASVILNPVDYGSGLKIKTIEAIAYGKCLLSTPVGGEGLEEHFNSAFHVSETGLLAEPLMMLMEDAALRTRYKGKARELYASRFQPVACYSNLRDSLLNLAKAG